MDVKTGVPQPLTLLHLAIRLGKIVVVLSSKLPNQTDVRSFDKPVAGMKALKARSVNKCALKHKSNKDGKFTSSEQPAVLYLWYTAVHCGACCAAPPDDYAELQARLQELINSTITASAARNVNDDTATRALRVALGVRCIMKSDCLSSAGDAGGPHGAASRGDSCCNSHTSSSNRPRWRCTGRYGEVQVQQARCSSSSCSAAASAAHARCNRPTSHSHQHWAARPAGCEPATRAAGHTVQ